MKRREREKFKGMPRGEKKRGMRSGGRETQWRQRESDRGRMIEGGKVGGIKGKDGWGGGGRLR